jgi:hypothetical protein
LDKGAFGPLGIAQVPENEPAGCAEPWLYEDDDPRKPVALCDPCLEAELGAMVDEAVPVIH